MPIDVTQTLESATNRDLEPRGLSAMAQKLIGSEILRIAAEVRALIADGKPILNLTVGDFSSAHFPVPKLLSDATKKAIDDGHTNYPPSNGVFECRQAVQQLFERRLDLSYPIESVLIAGGARPMIAGAYLALINPGEKVVYGLPSWNNNHYCNLVGAEPVEIATSRSSGFFPRAADIAPHISSARMICINTPQNPTGTVLERAELTALCEMIVAENKKRAAEGRRELYLLFDQVYWLLTFEGSHATPVNVVPEIAAHTVFVDGISKGFAATGLRVGWTLGAPDVINKMKAILTHIGAWAPRPEQVATAALLNDDDVIDAYGKTIRKEVHDRLAALNTGIMGLKADGHDVDAISPQGAIYLSIRINLRGKKTADGRVLETDEDTRQYVLEEAGIALIPFMCFGLKEDSAWFRASVGTVSTAQCAEIGQRLRTAFEKLT